MDLRVDWLRQGNFGAFLLVRAHAARRAVHRAHRGAGHRHARTQRVPSPSATPTSWATIHLGTRARRLDRRPRQAPRPGLRVPRHLQERGQAGRPAVGPRRRRGIRRRADRSQHQAAGSGAVAHRREVPGAGRVLRQLVHQQQQPDRHRAHHRREPVLPQPAARQPGAPAVRQRRLQLHPAHARHLQGGLHARHAGRSHPGRAPGC